MSKRAGSGRRVVMSGCRRENQKGVCHVAGFFLGIRPGYCDLRRPWCAWRPFCVRIPGFV
jgi:hypothetical protein